jgi:hypothetical protein
MHTMRTSCRRCKECTKPSFSCSLPGCTYDTFNANRCAVGAIRPNRTLATASSRSATNTNDEPTRAPGKPVALTHPHHDPPRLLPSQQVKARAEPKPQPQPQLFESRPTKRRQTGQKRRGGRSHTRAHVQSHIHHTHTCVRMMCA